MIVVRAEEPLSCSTVYDLLAWSQGRHARSWGADHATNPYPATSQLGLAWTKGWRSGKLYRSAKLSSAASMTSKRASRSGASAGASATPLLPTLAGAIDEPLAPGAGPRPDRDHL